MSVFFFYWKYIHNVFMFDLKLKVLIIHGLFENYLVCVNSHELSGDAKYKWIFSAIVKIFCVYDLIK